MRSTVSHTAKVALFAVSGAFLLAACTITTTTATSPAYPTSSLEWNVDRPGFDYRSFDLASPSPEQCQAACMNEASCLAFTYMNPGVQGPNARCWLKNAVPNAVPQTCCVSGTKYASAPPAAAPEAQPPAPSEQQPPAPPEPPAQSWQGAPVAPVSPAPPAAAAPAQPWQGTPVAPAPPPPPPASAWQGRPVAPPPRQWEPDTDRPGSDYRTFDLRGPRPELCRDACWREPQCRAFTYVRPGVQGPNARCLLKSFVPPSRPGDCCLSGVK